MTGSSSSFLDFPAIWLRTTCACSSCRDPGTLQSLYDITAVPCELEIEQISENADGVEIVFAPDGHRSTFAWAWLDAHRLGAQATLDARGEDAKDLWAAADLNGDLPEAEWRTYLSDDGCRARCLQAVLRRGFVLLHGVPSAPGTVLQVARTFGFVRETNYGSVFDVRVKPDPNNLAFTGLPLSPHTDNPYRDPVPTVQLLHCLVDASVGGESGLVDGFRAAARLRAEDPDAFATLTTTAVPFAFSDSTTELSTLKPLIGLDAAGRIREVRFSNRHMQPLRNPPADVVAFYASYRQFAELIDDPSAQVTFKLGPGDCVIFDNTRILHARTAFDAAGERHLQGCYADLDSLASCLNVLLRDARASYPSTA